MTDRQQHIDRYTWDRSMADRLIAARGSMSRYRLTKEVKAKIGNCADRTLYHYENANRQSISRELLEAVCGVLEVSVEFIIYGENK